MNTKNILKLIPVVIVTLILASCGSGGGAKADKTATDFLTALSNGDFEAAKGLVTEDSKEGIESLQMLAADQVKGKKYTVVSTKEDGDKAVATYTEEGGDGEKTLNLVKKDGKWAVAFDKTEFTGTNDLQKELENLGDELQDAAGEAGDKMDGAANDAADMVKDAADATKDKVEEMAH